MPLAPGIKAPDFTLKSMSAEGLVDISLSQHAGQDNVVLLFFPAAFTHVCTAELCDTSNGVHDLKGAKVYGVSYDTPFALDAWAKASGIGVPLLSDFTHAVTASYDVVLSDLAGLGPAPARASFVIDKEGVIRYSEQVPTLEQPNFAAITEALASLS